MVLQFTVMGSFSLADCHATSCHRLVCESALVDCAEGANIAHFSASLTKMHITKIADDGYHVEVKDRFIDEDVNGSQFLGIASERTSPMRAVEILRLTNSQYIGYTLTVDYHWIKRSNRSEEPLCVIICRTQ
jgi:hypothetical protein